MTQNSEIATRLKELRLKHNMEQADVAEKMGYKSFTTISKWESGINLPNGGKLAKLAQLFNTTTDYILFGKNPSASQKTSAVRGRSCSASWITVSTPNSTARTFAS